MDVSQEASKVFNQLLGEIRGKFAQSQNQQGVFDSLKAFTAAVDWKVILLTCSTWSAVSKRAKHLISLMLCTGALVDRSLECTNISFFICPSLPLQHLIFDRHFCAGK